MEASINTANPLKNQFLVSGKPAQLTQFMNLPTANYTSSISTCQKYFRSEGFDPIEVSINTAEPT